MDIRQTFAVLARRWYVVAPLLLLTVLLAQRAYAEAAPTYTVVSNLAVLPPGEATVRQEDGELETVRVNPFLNFTGSTQTAAAALALIASSDEFRSTLPESAAGALYSVVVPPRNPTLQLSVTDSDLERAVRNATSITTGLQAELNRRQAGIPATQSLSITVLTAPAVAGVDSAKVRAAAIVGALGALFTAALAFAVEGLGRSRQLRRSMRAPGPSARAEASPTSEKALQPSA